MDDLDKLSFGMVLDMYAEMSNDSVDYYEIATQEDMDNF